MPSQNFRGEKMRKVFIILFCTTLFAQDNITGSLKWSQSEFGNSSEFGLETKGGLGVEVMYNRYLSNSTFVGIGYTMETLTYEDIVSTAIIEEDDTVVNYHGFNVELNQEVIQTNSFSLYGGVHYKHLWSASFSPFSSAIAILTQDPKYFVAFDKTIGPGFQVGTIFKTKTQGKWGLQYYKSDDWSGIKLQIVFDDWRDMYGM